MLPQSQAGKKHPLNRRWVCRQPLAPPAIRSRALVLSIASWVIFPIVLAIVSLVFANKAEKEIAASNGSIGGGPLVTASKIVSWVNIGLYAALVILGILALFAIMILGVWGS